MSRIDVDNTKANEYVNKVCTYIKNKKVHENIKEELLSHIDEIAECYIEMGLSEEEAVEKAIKQMGSSEIVGKDLNKVHKAAPDWLLIEVTSIMIAFGLFTLWFMENNKFVEMSIFRKNAMFAIIGLITSFIIIKSDYRKINKYSKSIYILSIVGAIAAKILYKPVNGTAGWVNYGSGAGNGNVKLIVLFMLIVALCGIMENYNWQGKKQLFKGMIIAYLPSLIFLFIPSLASLIIYVLSATIIMVLTGYRMKYVLITYSSALILFIMYIFSAPYRVKRFLTFLNPLKDANDAGWLYLRIKQLTGSAGLFGNWSNCEVKYLPSIYSDFTLTFIINCFGWIIATVLLVTIFVFIIRLGTIGKRTKDMYGKLLASSICGMFLGEFILTILANLSLSPIAGTGIPFISYGGSQLLVSMIAIAIISNIHKLRNVPEKIKV